MKPILFALLLFSGIMLAGCSEDRPGAEVAETPVAGPVEGEPWRALHLTRFQSDEALDRLAQSLPQLEQMGLNTLILAVNYKFAFESHPELRQGDTLITKEGARKFVDQARQHGIQVIPQFMTLGHQSWAENTYPLLTVYPELDMTPGAFPNNEGIYCREWDPYNPKVYEIIFPMIDEVVEAFDSDYIHVGMDEVFLIGSPESPSTRGKDPAEVFAKVVNDLHAHLVGERGLKMIMWGDRLIDGEQYPHGRWEASMNGTAGAVDMIPKDIIIAPWHYNLREDGYPSVKMFLDKGFKVLPANWNKVDATQALIKASQDLNHPNMIGHMFTTWSRVDTVTAWQPMVEGLPLVQTVSANVAQQ